MVTVLGDHEVSIRRTLKHVIRLVTDTCLAAAWTIETPNVTKRYDTEEQARKLAIETDVEMAAGAGCIEAFSGESGISGARRVFDMLENPTSLVSAAHEPCHGQDSRLTCSVSNRRATLRTCNSKCNL
jgi:hypothetical protein